MTGGLVLAAAGYLPRAVELTAALCAALTIVMAVIALAMLRPAKAAA
jgi:hypothetical protein